MSLPRAVLVDIDGTVALHTTRSPYDWQRVAEDEPNLDVIEVVRRLATTGVEVVFLSGRDERSRTATLAWLSRWFRWDVEDIRLHMRPARDMRKDALVKLELFDRHIKDTYDVLGVFDDRCQVVAMWRELGLTCFQVADGDF